jgi:hypothetical protein
MRLNFSFNEMEAFALALSRYDEIYDLVRDFRGLKVGVYADSKWLRNQLSEDGNPFLRQAQMTDPEGILLDEYELIRDLTDFSNVGRVFWSIRGQEFDCNMIYHAIAVEEATLQLKIALQKVHQGVDQVKTLAKARANLVQLLLEIEW